MGETNRSGRPDESEAERLTRNLNELLQELRVTQTGIQILTGFLLTLRLRVSRSASLSSGSPDS